jgi:transposase
MSVTNGYGGSFAGKVSPYNEPKLGRNLQTPSLRKKNRILELYHKAPKNSVVLCFDEWGPLELKPIHGQHWAQIRHPDRLRATYRRLAGTEQFLGFYDVHRDCLAGTIHKRKRVLDLLTAFKRLRRAYPKKRKLYVIIDNLPHHKNSDLLEYFSAQKIVPVWTPTYASWLNIIEPHFGAIKKYTLNGSDDPDHHTRRLRIYKYLRLRNRKAGTNKCLLNTVFNH